MKREIRILAIVLVLGGLLAGCWTDRLTGPQPGASLSLETRPFRGDYSPVDIPAPELTTDGTSLRVEGYEVFHTGGDPIKGHLEGRPDGITLVLEVDFGRSQHGGATPWFFRAEIMNLRPGTLMFRIENPHSFSPDRRGVVYEREVEIR